MPKQLRHMSDDQLVMELPYSEAAYTEIYNRYWEKLLFVSATKLHNTSIAEEIVQDIFLDLWRRRSEISITVSLEAYLSVAVKYRIINAQVRLKREQDYLQTQQESVFETDRWLDEQELNKYYSQLISELPEKCRITYKLSREEGMTLKEISNVMAVSQKAVEANLTRSLKLLRFGLRKIMFLIICILSVNVDLPAIFAGL